MTRQELKIAIKRTPADHNADYKLIMSQGDTNASFEVTTAELVLLSRQMSQAVPDWYPNGDSK